MFLGLQVIAISSACVSVLLDKSILQYLGLIRGQLHSAFIVVVAHCFFDLILSALGCFSVYRRGYKTIVAVSVLYRNYNMLQKYEKAALCTVFQITVSALWILKRKKLK